jgi:hypothetical protein
MNPFVKCYERLYIVALSMVVIAKMISAQGDLWTLIGVSNSASGRYLRLWSATFLCLFFVSPALFFLAIGFAMALPLTRTMHDDS